MSIERELLERAMSLIDYRYAPSEAVAVHREIKECLAQPEQSEQELVTDKPTETAMAYMPNGSAVSNVYEAYEEGRKSVMSEQQPEAWIIVNRDTGYRIQVSLFPDLYNKDMFEVIPLYTAPPKREPLSDEEMRAIWKEGIRGEIPFVEIGRAIEKAHGIGVDDETK